MNKLEIINKIKTGEKVYTDYPIRELGDNPYCKAPIREIQLLSYDGDKYCMIKVEDIEVEIKRFYVYDCSRRLE